MVKRDNYSNDTTDHEHKLFIGNLSRSTTEDGLRSFYEKWGELKDLVIMMDKNTRASRGFGFVTYATEAQLEEAMANRPHVIDGRTVDPKRAVPREQSNSSEANISTNRLYVSGIRDAHTDEKLQDYFKEFGNVEKVEIITDRATGKKRGFAFVTFDDYDPVDKCVFKRRHMIDGQRCDVKKALTKEQIAKGQQMDRDRQMRSGRSRGYERPMVWNEGYGTNQVPPAYFGGPSVTEGSGWPAPYNGPSRTAGQLSNASMYNSYQPQQSTMQPASYYPSSYPVFQGQGNVDNMNQLYGTHQPVYPPAAYNPRIKNEPNKGFF